MSRTGAPPRAAAGSLPCRAPRRAPRGGSPSPGRTAPGSAPTSPTAGRGLSRLPQPPNSNRADRHSRSPVGAAPRPALLALEPIAGILAEAGPREGQSEGGGAEWCGAGVTARVGEGRDGGRGGSGGGGGRRLRRPGGMLRRAAAAALRDLRGLLGAAGRRQQRSGEGR